MPSDYYLKLDGVKGESQAEGMTDNIDLESWSFGASSPASLGGKGLSAGKASFSDFTCGFSLEACSYQVLKNLAEGTHINSAVFTGRKTGGGGTPYPYLVVTMNHCYVTGFSTGGGSAGVPSANLSLAYEEIKYEYKTQDTASGSVSTAGTATYDIKKVKAS
jgi:type VI secretion system secreted protein Hcp